MRYLSALAIGLAGVAVLVALGIWQVQRLAWKEDILQRIDTRLAAAPVALPADPDPEADRYLPVRVAGKTGERELHVLVSTRQQGAGFRIVTALETKAGRRILLDRGFVPAERKDAPRPPARVEVTGNLHWPEERDGFTPQNDVAANYWYARDLQAMAQELGTEPLMVVARSVAGTEDTVAPLPLDTSGIPNDHLGYAVTWFGLAAVWAGMTALLLRRIARRTAQTNGKGP